MGVDALIGKGESAVIADLHLANPDGERRRDLPFDRRLDFTLGRRWQPRKQFQFPLWIAHQVGLKLIQEYFFHAGLGSLPNGNLLDLQIVPLNNARGVGLRVFGLHLAFEDAGLCQIKFSQGNVIEPINL